jgi:hypothetical protein
MRSTLLTVLLLLAACAPRYGVVQRADPFERVTVRRMRGDLLGGPGAGADWVALNAEETRPAGDTARYALVVDYRTQGEWLEIRPGESLLLLVDGDRVALSGPGSTRARSEGAAARREVARYPASGELMRRIAAARDVRVRLVGRRYHVDRAFTRTNVARFRGFLGAPVDGRQPLVPPASPRGGPPPPAPGPPPAR